MIARIRASNLLVLIVTGICVLVSALPAFPYRLIDALEHRTCVAPTRDVDVGTQLTGDVLQPKVHIHKDQLPKHAVHHVADIVGRTAEKKLILNKCLSFDDVDVKRVAVVVSRSAVIADALAVGSRVDLVVSPTSGQDNSPGLVVKRAIVQNATSATVTFAVTEAERTALAAQLARSQVSVSLDQ